MNTIRRKLVLALGAGVFAIPLCSLTSTASASVPRLNPKTAPGKALNYTHKSNNGSKVCAGCQFYTHPTMEWGPCQIFPGTHVNAKGRCNAWKERAG